MCHSVSPRNTGTLWLFAGFLSLYKSCNVPLEDYYRLLRSVTCERCSFAIILEKYPMTEATQCDLLFGAWYNAHIHCVVKSLI